MLANRQLLPLLSHTALRLSLATILPLLGTAMPAQVTWRTGLAEAKAVAKRCNQLVLVAVHEAGDAASEQEWRVVLANRRLADALGKDVLPVLVCLTPAGCEKQLQAVLPGADVDRVRRLGHAAILDLFGPNASVATPQQLILHSDGSVLWHGLRGHSLSELRRSLDEARSDAKRNAQLRGNAVRTRAARLGKQAEHDRDAFDQLAVLARHASAAHFTTIVEAIAAEPELVGRLLANLSGGMSPARAADLTAELEANRRCGAFAKLIKASAPGGPATEEREILSPLPKLRDAQDLDAVRFADGAARTLHDLHGRPTVLLFLLRGANFAAQAAALKPEIEDLQERGVACLALFAALDPEAELTEVRKLDLSCPIGTYAFDKARPYQTVGFFPTALVLDGESHVVYADENSSGTRCYTAFAPTARGLARYLHAQPLLWRGKATGAK